MKKFTSFLIAFCIYFSNVSSVSCVFALENVEDELIQLLNSDLKIEIQEQVTVSDDLIKYLDSDLKIKPQEEVMNKDKLLNYLDPDLKIEKIIPKSYLENGVSYKIRIKEALTTKNKDLKEGEAIDFILVEDTQNYKKGAIIKARIENISKNAIYGVPASISVSNFKIDDNVLDSTIEKTGANRAIWVYPASYFLSFFFGIGIFLIAIRGGHAKLKPNEIYIIGG